MLNRWNIPLFHLVNRGTYVKATIFISRTQLAAGTRIMLSGENVFLDKNPGWNSAAGDLFFGVKKNL